MNLIEYVIVMVLMGILCGGVSVYFVAPMVGYVNVAHRGQLVEAANHALFQMSQDIANALPNSVVSATVGNTVSLSMTNTVSGFQYRSFAIDAPTSGIDIFGKFPAAQLGTHGYRVAIDNTITPASTRVTLSRRGGEGHIALAPAFLFAAPSPQQRVYIVDAPISYVCDLNAGTLMRYWGDVNVQSALVTRHVTNCAFSSVYVSVTVAQDGASVTLSQPVRLNNAI
jgi:MSHA biogenesis protein MshO